MHAMMQRRKPVALSATRLADLFSSAANMVRRRSTVFVVSDFISEPGWEKPLGLLAQIPTLNREDLVSAIDRFQLQRGTAIGNGSVVFPLISLKQMKKPIHARSSWFLYFSSDHFVDRWKTYHRSGFAGGGQIGI